MFDVQFSFKDIAREAREEGMEKGMEKGREEGRKEGRENLILKMLQKGKTAESIADDTDIPISKIISVQERMLVNA